MIADQTVVTEEENVSIVSLDLIANAMLALQEIDVKSVSSLIQREE